jgi:hypothetical protein
MGFYDVGYVNLNHVTTNRVQFEDIDSPWGYRESRLVYVNWEVDTLCISNSIFQFETETGDFLIAQDPVGTQIDVRYSNITYGYPGTGNLDVDPLFIDPENGDFRLQANSLCIDAGDPDPAHNDAEDPNEPGWPLWPAQGTLRSDMGCYGGPGVADFDEFMAVPGAPQPPVQPSTIELHQNYPNPFNPTTTIEFTLPHPQDVQLTVYNILGQQVQLLTDRAYSAGIHQVRFDGYGLASGVYIYRLVAGDDIVSRKMILVQ